MITVNEGDILTLKKMHPCGSDRFEVIRAGADIRLKCTGCGKLLLLQRRQVEKGLKSLLPAAPGEGE